MTRIRSIGTALPQPQYSAQEILEAGAIWLSDVPQKYALFERFVRASQTARRSLVLPPKELIRIGGLSERAALFETHGTALGCTAVTTALARAEISSSSIAAQVFTSCSVPTIPAIDAEILRTCGMHPTTQRVPVFQYGCAGGVTGLTLAARLVRPHAPVLLTAVELCSLVFQFGDHSSAQLVGAAIFSDGAASVVLDDGTDGLTITRGESYLIPHTRHLMGYDTKDDGFHLRLDKELPSALAGVVKERVDQFLAQQELARSNIAHWLFHPGEKKILDILEKLLEVPHERAHWSLDVLTTIGNLSSASVLFVLNAFLESRKLRHGDNVIMLGIGPGLTLELILFTYRE